MTSKNRIENTYHQLVMVKKKNFLIKTAQTPKVTANIIENNP